MHHKFGARCFEVNWTQTDTKNELLHLLKKKQKKNFWSQFETSSKKKKT